MDAFFLGFFSNQPKGAPPKRHPLCVCVCVCVCRLGDSRRWFLHVGLFPDMSVSQVSCCEPRASLLRASRLSPAWLCALTAMADDGCRFLAPEDFRTSEDRRRSPSLSGLAISQSSFQDLRDAVVPRSHRLVQHVGPTALYQEIRWQCLFLQASFSLKLR